MQQMAEKRHYCTCIGCVYWILGDVLGNNEDAFYMQYKNDLQAPLLHPTMILPAIWDKA